MRHLALACAALAGLVSSALLSGCPDMFCPPRLTLEDVPLGTFPVDGSFGDLVLHGEVVVTADRVEVEVMSDDGGVISATYSRSSR